MILPPKSLILDCKESCSLQSKIKDLGGSITSTDVWGKRHLAYEIDSNSEGYYVVYKITLPLSKNDQLDQYLRLNKNILRYILISEDKL